MAMNPSQARVIDPILTEVARGYMNPGYVGDALFPVVPVGQRGGRVIKFSKEHFMRYATQRAPGTNFATVEYGYSSDGYALTQHALRGKVPIELMDEAKAVPGIDLSKNAVIQTREIILLELEIQRATLALNASLYDSANKATLSGSTQWSHADSNPAKAVRDAGQVIRGKVGKLPSVLLLGAPVFAALQEHPKIIDRIKYTGRDNVTEDMLAQLFGLEKVVVGGAVQANAAGVLSDVWGKHAVLAYSVPGNLASMGTPSYGYTYQLRNHPIVEPGFFDRDTDSWLYPVKDEVDPQLVGAEAGFLFTNAVA